MQNFFLCIKISSHDGGGDGGGEEGRESVK